MIMGLNQKPLIIILGISMLLFKCAGRTNFKSSFATQKINNWVCNYSDSTAVEEITKFDLAVLDADAHPNLSQLKKSNTILIGYVSLAEVGNYRWFWPEIANKDWVLDKNPNWGGHMIDVRDKEWHELLVNKIIPKILSDGFDGIFLDTIDTAEYLEKYHPEKKRAGSLKGMTQLIKKIRKKFPEIYIIANRGFAILDNIGRDIDGVVAESIFTSFDFQNNRMRLLDAAEYEPKLTKLLTLKKKYNLKIFTLDYVTPAQSDKVRHIIAFSRKRDFVPYISTPKLNKIYDYTLEM